ncbi:TrbG/VirB9 family P-type conjugative transfer protein [Notoacmeibacter ruber]|nr:TrbG/VirB9 family P-type conjugative transfer protein [Notoacmeibacter ruber]
MFFKRLLILLCAGFCLVGPVQAEQTPIASQTDSRIKRYVYDENNVYRLDLYLKSITAVQFDTGEVVESIIIGDSASWEITKLNAGNVVSIKPIVPNALTNMTVYTDRRVYTFELHCAGEIEPGEVARQSFRTIFSYPGEEAEFDESLAVDGPVDNNYLVSGFAPFRPIAVQDNTLQTTFLLPKGAPRPAIFKVGPDKSEELVNSRTDGGSIVVDGTSDYWVLRIGDESVCIGKAGVIRQSKAVVRAAPAPHPRKAGAHKSQAAGESDAGFFTKLLRGGRHAG